MADGLGCASQEDSGRLAEEAALMASSAGVWEQAHYVSEEGVSGFLSRGG